MSLHSYSRCWLHLTWATLRRERMLPKRVGVKVSSFLYDYSREKGIYMKSNYVNPDHAHAVIDLPTKYSIEKVLQLLKGASSHWINANRMIGRQVCVGTRLRCVLDFALESGRSGAVHRQSGGASPSEVIR